MCLQVRCIDHQRISSAALIGQFEKHPREDTLLAPTLPTTVEGLVRPVFCRRVLLPQAIAIDEDNAAQHPPGIDTRLAVGLRKEGLQLCHLRIAQPIKVDHVIAPFSEP